MLNYRALLVESQQKNRIASMLDGSGLIAEKMGILQWSFLDGVAIYFRVHLLTLGDYIGPKKHRKFIVIGQIIGSSQIDSFMCIELVIASIYIFNYLKFIAH